MVCEMCGNASIIKQGEYYQCQFCGTKYEPEGAKKLLVEVDNSSSMNKLYQRARRTREIGDYEHVEEQYREIMALNPDDWEAYFYTYLWSNFNCKADEISYVASLLSKTLPKAFDLAVANVSKEVAEARIRTITDESIVRINQLATFARSITLGVENSAGLSTSAQINMNTYLSLRSTVSSALYDILNVLAAIDNKLLQFKQTGILNNNELYKYCALYVRTTQFNISTIVFRPTANRPEFLIDKKTINRYLELVKALNPNFEVPSSIRFAVQDTSTQRVYINKSSKTRESIGLVIGIVSIVIVIIFVLIMLNL